MVPFVLTGEQLKAARGRARMTQDQAANAAGVTLRTWGNWERSDVLSTTIEARARQVVGQYVEAYASDTSPLSSVSDAQLLAEIARRFERKKDDDGTATNRAGERPAPTSLEAIADDALSELPAQDQVQIAALQEQLRRGRDTGR